MEDVRGLFFLFSLKVCNTLNYKYIKIYMQKKMKKTYKIICIYQKSGVPLSSSSGKKLERLTKLFTY